MLTQEEYIAAIKKQQTLIRRLFRSRNRRSEIIDELTQERYKSLIGRFFRPQGNLLKNAAEDVDYFICDIRAESNFIMSDTVYIEIVCRYISRTFQGCDNPRPIVGIDVAVQSFRFMPENNIDEILAPMMVDKTQAIETINDYYKQLFENLLKTKD